MKTERTHRGGYAARDRHKLISLAITTLLHVIVGIAFLVQRHQSYVIAPPAGPLIVELVPLASHEDEPTPPKPAAPEEREKAGERSSPIVEPVISTLVPSPAITTKSTPTTPASAPNQERPVEDRHETPPPSASHRANAAPDSWEGQLLARIEQQKRYPAAARARRIQGVVFIQFVLNRDGSLLSCDIQRSSGSADLDRAALAALRRAAPFPRIPADRSDPIEVAVPVEFFIR